MGIDVGYGYDKLRQEAEKCLSKELETIHQKAYEASASIADIDQKIAAAVAIALQEALPRIIAITINANNKGLGKTLDNLVEQANRAGRR